MKHAKKAIGLLLALVMVFTMVVSVFATEIGDTPTEDTNPGSIIVDNPVSGKTYRAYKIFDVVYNDAKTAYSYTISENSEWFDVVAEITNGEVNSKITGLKFENTDSGNTYVVTQENSFDAAIMASTLNKSITGKTGWNFASSEDKAVVNNLPLGYYLVTSTSGALCNLTTTEPSVTIHDKNDILFEKEDDKVSADVGEKVNYTITGQVPNTAGFTDYSYIITDTMSNGLTFNAEDVKVAIKGGGITDSSGNISDKVLTKGTDYEYVKNDNGFTLTIKVEDLQSYVGKAIEVTYSAIVNENAVVKIEKNKAILTYSNDPNDSTKKGTITREEQVYSSKIVIDKYQKNNNTLKLSGATFLLYKVVDDNGNNKTLYYQFDQSNSKVVWTENEKDATPKTTDAKGEASFDGLADGTYYLKETVAPKDYNLLTDPVKIQVNGENAIDENLSALTVTQGVENESGSLLPSTGGTGTTLFYIIGGILVIGAAVLLITKYRMKGEE